MAIITLTTDFGLQDWFVGTMKGVLLGIAPSASIVDISHDIPFGSIAAGAFALAAAFRFFPRGTIHLAVVDPGVGSERTAILAETRNYFFVGPDNGLLSLAFAQERPERLFRLSNPKFFLKQVSRTFHGRDVFAPVAGYLLKGVRLEEFGPKQTAYQVLDLPKPTERKSSWTGNVVYIDRFGNGITNLASNLSIFHDLARVQVRLPPRKTAIPARPFYQAVPPGKAVAVLGSAGYLEIAVNGGRAAETLGLRVGGRVIAESRSCGN